MKPIAGIINVLPREAGQIKGTIEDALKNQVQLRIRVHLRLDNGFGDTNHLCNSAGKLSGYGYGTLHIPFNALNAQMSKFPSEGIDQYQNR
jgi:hypothetical protein